MRIRLPDNPPNISARTVRGTWAFVIVLAIAVMASMVIGLIRVSADNESLAAKVERSDKERAKLSKRVDDEHAAAQALNDQVKRLGGKPVVQPGEQVPGPAGPGPTAAQVRAAVADYCTGDRCTPTVSRSQVAAAVADYCAGGACQAPPPKDGADGTDGTDGAPGPGPTDEQIAAAVADYCAGGACQAPPPKDGTDGADGKDGRGIESISCESGTGTFTFTFTDGTTQQVTCAPPDLGPDTPQG